MFPYFIIWKDSRWFKMQTLRLASTLLNLAKIIKCRNRKSFDNELI